MRNKILTIFVMFFIAITLAVTACHEKPKVPEQAADITEPADETEGEPSEGQVPEVGKDTISPKISGVSPSGSGVGINEPVSITFSEAMDASSITTNVIIVSEEGGDAIDGDVSYTGVTAVFNPVNNLKANTVYKVIVKKDVKDKAGNAMEGDYAWQFKTGEEADTEKPQITGTIPQNGQTGVDTESNIVIMFTEAMDPETINNDTFKVVDKASGNEVAGVVTYADEAAEFDPTETLTADKSYIVSASTDMKDQAGNNLMEFLSFDFITAAVVDTVKPYVTSSIPSMGETNVSTNVAVQARFSEPMLLSSISTANIHLQADPNISVSGTVDYDGALVTFTPDAPLAANTEHRFVIKKEVSDLSHNNMENDWGMVFVTGVAVDDTPPEVVESTPVMGDINVSPSANMVFKFSEDMNSDTMITSTFPLYDMSTSPAELVACTVSYSSAVATVTPNSQLKDNTVYRMTVIGEEAKDIAGNSMSSNYQLQFTTGTAPDTVPPTYLSWDPSLNETNVSPTTQIIVVFSEEMKEETVLNENAIQLYKSPEGTLVPGRTQYSEGTATFIPGEQTPVPLMENTIYRLVVKKDVVEDLAGNHPEANLNSQFTTGTMPDTVPPTVESVDPADEAIQIPTNIGEIKIIFSEPMDQESLQQPNVFVLQSTATSQIVGFTNIIYYDSTVRLSIDGYLEPDVTDRFAVRKSVSDAAGNPMTDNFNSTFTTGSGPE